MAMNALIPLMGTSPDIAGSYGRGMEVRQQGIENDRRNALAAMLQQQGPGIMAGDQNALAALAGYDPQMAVGIQSQQLGQKATRQNMQIDQQKLKLAMEAGQRAAQEHGARMSAFEREQAAAETAGLVEGLAYAWKAGPEEWARAAPTLFGQAGHNGDIPGYEDAPYVLMNLGATAEAFKAEAPDLTSGMKEYEFARSQGYQGTFEDWKTTNAKAGATNLTVGGEPSTIGTIPPGFAAVPDQSNAAGYRFEAIPGGPAEADAQAAAGKADAAAGQRDTKTDVITDAASRAREIATAGWTTGLAGQVAGGVPSSQSAELRRQTAVLSALGTIETLNAMRQSSPTGGALGNVTEGEGRMLAAAAGALDPNAGQADYLRALDNYERTLLRIVHGPEAGDRIFAETRRDPPPPGDPGVEPLDSILDRYR